jgi:predicted DNA-binding protein with PD1-like motif
MLSFSKTESKGRPQTVRGGAGSEDFRAGESKAMINIKLLGYVLALIGVTAIMVRPQYTAGDYVSPSEAVLTGKAPKMQVQLLNPGEATKQYAVIFYQGDEAFSGLEEFAEKYHVTSAHFTAIGALSGATLGWFDPQRKMYKKIPIDGQHEVIGMSGDIALYQGRPVVHTHMVVGGPDGTTHGGHVLEAYVSPTLEVMVTVDPATMQKRFDPATDLTLIDPALK